MPYVLVGKYISEDGNQIFEITRENDVTGSIDGVFTNKATPMGEMIYAIDINSSRFVYTKGVGSATGLAIFPWVRTESWNEGLFDYWAGSYTKANGLIMTGALSHYTNDGKQHVVAFPDVKFTKIA